MGVKDWISAANRVETYEPFNGSLAAGGVLVGSPAWVDGVDGQGLRCGANEGATVPTTAETARGYPLSVSIWFSFQSAAASVPIFQWGTQPSVGARLFGADSAETPGSVEAHVRMSNGRYAMRVRSGALAPNRWHLLTITVAQTTIWGGARGTAFLNGREFGTGNYNGSLFDIVHFNRPQSVTVGVGDGAVSVDELVTQEYALSASQAQAFYQSADSLEAATRSGWGVVF